MEHQSEVLNNPVTDDASFELGQWLGRRQAFGLIAGKTAAADVECLRRTAMAICFAPEQPMGRILRAVCRRSPARMPTGTKFLKLPDEPELL